MDPQGKGIGPLGFRVIWSLRFRILVDLCCIFHGVMGFQKVVMGSGS